MDTTVENVICAVCGCLCEDATVHINNGVITEVDDACKLCTELLLGQSAGAAADPPIAEAVEILANSRAPLIYGLTGSTVEAQRAAVALAEALGGTIDLALPDFHRATLQAVQSVGISTCTLGEVRQRADVVVFWGADLKVTHPLLMERFIVPQGQFVAGKRDVLDVGSDSPDYPVDEFIEIQTADNLAALTTLRLAAGIPSSTQLGRLANRLQNAAYSVILFGPKIGGLTEIESLFRLVRELNSRSRCAVIGLGGTQIENVLTWQTGYPCSVNFALGYPRYDPCRFQANSLLERGEVDSVVLIGNTGLNELSPKAQSRLGALPVVHLAFPESTYPFEPTVQMTVARPGVHSRGTVFRMDGVPIKVRPVFDSPLPTTETILTAIQQGVCASCV